MKLSRFDTLELDPLRFVQTTNLLSQCRGVRIQDQLALGNTKPSADFLVYLPQMLDSCLLPCLKS